MRGMTLDCEACVNTRDVLIERWPWKMRDIILLILALPAALLLLQLVLTIVVVVVSSVLGQPKVFLDVLVAWPDFVGQKPLAGTFLIGIVVVPWITVCSRMIRRNFFAMKLWLYRDTEGRDHCHLHQFGVDAPKADDAYPVLLMRWRWWGTSEIDVSGGGTYGAYSSYWRLFARPMGRVLVREHRPGGLRMEFPDWSLASVFIAQHQYVSDMLYMPNLLNSAHQHIEDILKELMMFSGWLERSRAVTKSKPVMAVRRAFESRILPFARIRAQLHGSLADQHGGTAGEACSECRWELLPVHDREGVFHCYHCGYETPEVVPAAEPLRYKESENMHPCSP